MTKAVLIVAVALFVVTTLTAPVLAIVHAVTPIVEAGAVAASDGAAGGVAAADNVSETPAPGPPMPAEAGTELPAGPP